MLVHYLKIALRNIFKDRIYRIFLIILVVAACGNRRSPGLSDKDLFAQRKVETLQELEEQAPDFPDMETYVVPAGIKYKESRAVDPAHPPMVINIANRNLNIRKFNLNDYYNKVRYVKLKHPNAANITSFPRTRFTEDYIITGNNYGLHCFDKEGSFLYTIETNNMPEPDREGRIMFSFSDLKGYYAGRNGINNVNGNYCLYKIMDDSKCTLCLFDLTRAERIMTRQLPAVENYSYLSSDNKSIVSYVYDPVRAPKNLLFTFDLKGDTLCRFPSYHPIPVITGGSYNSPPSPDVYYYDKQLTIRQSLNDTVYRLISPNRLVPAYVLNFGAYGADVPTYFRGNLSEKLLPDIWKESEQYILFVYLQNRDTPNNRRDGSVQFFYSYFDKISRQFYHFSEKTSTPPEQFFMENPVPGALPFMLSYTEIEDNQLRVVYTKKRLEEISKSKEFASLPAEQQNKLKTMQNELDDSEVLIMILE